MPGWRWQSRLVDDRVPALVWQVPAFGDDVGADDPDGARAEVIASHLASGPTRRPADAWVSSSVVSPDQASSPSALLPLKAFRWLIEYGGRYGSGWTNQVTFTGPRDGPGSRSIRM